MIEQRCPCGFLRSAVPCPTCQPERYRFEKGDALGEEKGGILTRLGARIAGVTITKEYDKTYVEAECACGTRYRTYRSTITGAKRRGQTAKCAACIKKVRSEAQRRVALRGALTRDMRRQEAKQREKQGAAA